MGEEWGALLWLEAPHLIAELLGAGNHAPSTGQSGNFTFFSRPRGGERENKKNRAAREIMVA